MFKYTARQIATRQTTLAARQYSSQVAKAQSIANTFLTKGSKLTRVGLYYSKVAGELAKYVWIKESLSPPTVADLQKTFTSDTKAFMDCVLKAFKEPSKTIEQVKSFKSNDYIRGGAFIIQILGIFSLGEIIGRRHIYGYKDHEHAH